VHIEETYELLRGSLEEDLGSYNWCLLISTNIEDRLIHGPVNMEDLKFVHPADETAETYWSLAKNHSCNNPQRNPTPEPQFVEGGPSSWDYG
jgi:hypothetical protein